jgi:membrane protein YdbS with pleckstrin-like domain
MMPNDQERRLRARRSFGIAVAVLLLCLVAILIYGWFMLRDSALSTVAVIALGGGVLLTLILGIGLMSLLFYSHNEGYDDEVGR